MRRSAWRCSACSAASLWQGLVAVALVGCSPLPDAPEPPIAPIDPIEDCADPHEGFDRFTEVGLERGLDVPHFSPVEFGLPASAYGGSITVQDLDADGDLDIVSLLFNGEPVVYENDGAARFARIPQSWAGGQTPMSLVQAQGAVDLNGDELPDLLFAGMGRAGIAWNLGGLEFAEPESVLPSPNPPGNPVLYATLMVGDVDGDADLDLVLPGFAVVTSGDSIERGAPDLVLSNEGAEGWRETHSLVPHGDPGASFVGTLTDRDLDGDLDVFIASEGGHEGMPPSVFFRNDGPDEAGLVGLTDDAQALGADLPISGMGIATWDLNGDGAFDYCLTDVGPLACLISDGEGGYIEGGLPLGLAPAGADYLIFWSLELLDLDNDGVVDAVTAGGAVGGEGPGASFVDQPDTIWSGSRSEAGQLHFEDRSAELGFGDTEEHYGLVSADFDGDGYLDILTAGNTGPPKLWMNRCGANGWLEIELVGPASNSEAWGARLDIEIDGRPEMQELQAVRGFAQGPSRFHVGTGDADFVDRLVITWPDGATTELEDVPARQLLTLRHPGL